MAGKILIIDDDRDITQIIRILLEGEGFETCTAYSGAQALASLDETVELIILDIMMDGMNGFEACHRIRESSYVPILFLSAMSGDSEKVAALMAGGDDYLCKPFSIQDIYEAIWTEPYSYAANNIVMVHIFKLRHKIEADCKHPTILKTAWGKGYYID